MVVCLFYIYAINLLNPTSSEEKYQKLYISLDDLPKLIFLLIGSIYDGLAATLMADLHPRLGN